MTKWILFSCCVAMAACSSPTTPAHVNVVAGTFNDTAWNASQIAYLVMTQVTTTADSMEFKAYGNGDTLEVHALAQNNTTYTIAQPIDFIRLRRARGVFDIHLGADAFVDSVNCTRLYYGIVEGNIITGAALVNLSNPNDSVRINCHFSLQYVY